MFRYDNGAGKFNLLDKIKLKLKLIIKRRRS